MPTTFSYKAAVKCATIANGTLATAYAAGQVVDGYTLIAGDRILIKDQSTASQNGVYTVNATGAPTRATDMNAATMFPGAVVAVQEGTVNADSGWVCTADAGIVLETSDIVWAIFGGLKAGLGLAITADTIAITALNLATVTGLAVTGTPSLAIGNLDTAKVLTAITTDYTAAQIYIDSRANATSDDTSVIGFYCKVKATTAAQAHNHIQSILSNASAAVNFFDMYGVQGHATIAASCGTENANAHVTGISGKFVASAGTTLATGWATGGLFIVEGTGAVTQMCSVVSLVQEAGCSAAQQMLYINNDGTATKGIEFVGNFTTGITIPAMTLGITSAASISITASSSAYNNSILNVGKYGAGIADILTADNILVSFVNSSGVNKAGADTSSMTLYVGNSTTAAVTNNKMQGVLSSMGIGHNVFDAYAGQFHLAITGSMGTQNANAHLTGMSAKVSFTGTPTVATGWVTAGLFIIEGTGTCSQMCHGVSIVEEAGSTGAQSMLHLNTDVGTTPYFSFAGADGTGKSIYTHTAAGTQTGTIKVLINGTPAWIPFMQAE